MLEHLCSQNCITTMLIRSLLYWLTVLTFTDGSFMWDSSQNFSLQSILVDAYRFYNLHVVQD